MRKRSVLCAGTTGTILPPFRPYLLVVRFQSLGFFPLPKVLLDAVRVGVLRQLALRHPLFERGNVHSPLLLECLRPLIQAFNLQLQIFGQDLFEGLVEVVGPRSL